MTLNEQLYQNWLLQLQTWAAEGRLLAAGLDALQLKPGQATDQLKRVVERLAKGDTRDLPPIELLSGSAMPGAAGAYAKATKKIYINQEWIKTASEADAIRLLTEEFGHHLDDQLKGEDSPGDEGAIFAERLLNSYSKGAISSAQIDLINENDHGWISVNGQLIEAEFQLFEGTSGDDNFNGTGSTDTMYGYGGNDFLKGGGGSDYIYGGGGADTIYDKWTGDRDTVSNYLFGGEGNDTIIGGNKKDILRGDGNQSGNEYSNNEGNDLLKGHGGNDLLTGGKSEDRLNGGAGKDRFDGGPGADIIWGGGISSGQQETVYQHDGDSVIWTDAGNLASSATLINNETITFGNGTDVIYDFNHAQYHLYLPNNSFNLLSSGDALTGLTIGQNYFIQGSWSHTTFQNHSSNYDSNNYSGTFTTGESTNWNEDYSFLVLYNAQATDFFSTSNTNFLVLEFDYNASNTRPSKQPADMVAGINGTGNATDLNPLRGQKILINGPSGNAGDGSASFSLAENTSAVHTFSSTGSFSGSKSIFWSLSGGSDRSLFSINESTGALSFNTAPSYGNNTDDNSDGTYKVDVMATLGNTGSTASERSIDWGSLNTWQSVSITITDATAPTIAITEDDADDTLGAGDTSTLTFTLSEASTDFVESDVSVSGGSLSNWTAGSSTSYTATFTPTTNSTTNGVISVASSKFSDAAGNLNADGSDANNSVTFTVDTVRPTIAITEDDADDSLSAGDTSSLTFTLSEASTDFIESDVSVSGGSLSNWTAGSSTSYTATFTPTANSTTNGVISVASSKFSNSSGNTNNDGADANNSVTFTVDTVRPTIAITEDDADDSLSAGDTSTLTFTLSEASSNFIESDVSVSGGSLSNWTAVSSTVYTATFTPTTNSTTNGVISVASGTFTDAANNANTDGSDANNSVTFTVDTTTTPSPSPSPSPSPTPDTVRPKVAITNDDVDNSLSTGESSTLTFTLSETSTDFAESDVTITGGSLSNWTAVSSTVYTATFTPTADSTTDGVISVASSKFSDSAGNSNADGSDTNNSVTFSVDTTILNSPSSNDTDESRSQLIIQANNKGLHVTQGSGVWIQFESMKAITRNHNLILISDSNGNTLGSVGSTMNSGNLGQKEVYVPGGTKLYFQKHQNKDNYTEAPKINFLRRNYGIEMQLNDNPDEDDDYDDLSIKVTSSAKANKPKAISLASRQSRMEDTLLDLSTIKDKFVNLMVTITSNCNDANRVGLVKMNGSKEAGFTVGGISDSSKTAFKEAILDNMINLGKEKTSATGQQRQSVQMTIEAEDEGIYSPVFINETTDQIFTAFFASTGEDYAHIRNLGSNYFCYEDTADAMRSDWDFNDVTMQVEIM